MVGYLWAIARHMQVCNVLLVQLVYCVVCVREVIANNNTLQCQT